MATHSSILAWEIPWTATVSYSPWGHKESDTTESKIKSESDRLNTWRCSFCVCLWRKVLWMLSSNPIPLGFQSPYPGPPSKLKA